MTEDIPPTAAPPPSSRHRWLKRLALAGAVTTLAGALVAWCGYTLVRENLPEFLEDNLSAALGRPLKVGEFQRFGPTGVRLGPSIVPPTEEDFSWVKARALEVNFNPLELIFTRTLRPSVVFIQPEVALKQGFDGRWRVRPPQSVGERGLVRTRLRSLQIRNADLAIGPVSRTSIVEVPEGVTSASLILLKNVNLRLRFTGDDNQTVTLVVGGRLNNGAFQLRGEGQLDSRQANLAVQAQQIPVEAVNPLLGGNLFVRNGLLSANLDLRLRPQEADPLTVQGTARLRNGDLVITDLPAPLQDINGTLLARGVGGQLENSSLKFGSILVKAAGGVDLHKGHDLTVTLPRVSLAQVAETLDQPLPIPAEGSFGINTRITGKLLDPQLEGNLENLGPLRLDRLGFPTLVASFAANLRGFVLRQARLQPSTGGVITAQGRAEAQPGDWRQARLDLKAQTDLPLDGIATLYGLPLPDGFQLGPLQAQAQVQGLARDLRGEATWQLPQATFPGQGRLRYGQALLRAEATRFQVGDGQLQAEGQASLVSRHWQARLRGQSLPLAQVSPQLRGRLDADLGASGNLAQLNPQGIRAQGQIQLSQTLPLALGGAEAVLPGPLEARFAWTGSRLEVASAQAPGLYARGGANVSFPPGGGGPRISAMDFVARLTNFNLASAYTLLGGPAWLRPRGYLDFAGHLRGDWPQPQLAGTAGLRQLALNDRPLLVDVSGPVQASPAQGARLDLRGGASQLAARVGPDLRPQAFRVTNGEFLVQGQPQGEDLAVELRRFDLGWLALHPIQRPDLGPLGGWLEADARVNLYPWSNPAVTASFRLDRPSLGAIAAQNLTGQLGYRDGQALLTGGALALTPTTRFLFTGEGQLFPQWRARAEISTDNAQFQDILQTLGVYDYGDLGRLLQPRTPGQSTDLAVHSVGNPQAPLLNQATIARALATLGRLGQQQSNRALVPSLEDLEGGVSGRLSLNIAQGQDLGAEFSFTGQNWAWGRYDFDNQFLAQGQLQGQVLSLNPVEFRAGETRLGLLGDLGLAQSNLRVEAANLPLTAAANLLEIPFQVTGLLNLEAQLTGPYTNPQLQGEWGVAGATINQQPLQEIGSSFSYQDAIFNLQGQILGSSPEPLTFSGQVPYALPFMTVQPPSQAIALRASLKDDGFSLINLFTPLVTWGGGQANLDVAIGGTLRRPLVGGGIFFNQVRFNSPLLNTSLDNLTGAIQFQDQGIRVDSLTGNLWEGQLALTGDLPLTSQAARPEDQGLTLALGDLNFNFADEVSSQINGQVTLTNALLSPTIGGDLRLQDTRVAVGPEVLKLVNTVLLSPGVKALRQNLAAVRQIFPVQVNDLQLTLLPARVKAAPLFSLGLQGQLTLSGPVPGLYGDGVIALTEGWINTVTAEFFLEESRDNLIVFRPESKLDPELDLEFTAVVPLQRRYNINRPQTLTARAEVPDLDPLGANTIFDDLLIEARVTGPASRLFENLELSSNPPYSQNQLLSMVSGGYLSDLEGAEPALPLGINLLNAFTSDSQDAVGNALGLQRFRLTTTSLIPDTEGDRLNFGVGANLGITQNLSVSLIQVLNQAQPFAFNARYRIDDHWGVQGSTNFGNNSRLFLEYRLNFR